MSKPAELSLAGPPSFREAGLWTTAAAVVLLAHAVFAFAIHSAQPSDPLADAEAQALTIDLMPIPIAAAETVVPEVAPEEPLETISPVEEPAPAIVEAEEVLTPDEPVEPVEEVTPEEALPEEIVQPEPQEIEPDTVEPEVALPAEPLPKKEVKKAKPVKKPERQPPKKVQTEVRKVAKPAPQASQQPKVTTAPKVSPNAWIRAVRAAVVRRAASVNGMSGTVSVQFVVNTTGQIVSASLSSSSGIARLDSAALRMVRSARVPAQPPGLTDAPRSFNITLKFQ